MFVEGVSCDRAIRVTFMTNMKISYLFQWYNVLKEVDDADFQ